MAGHLLGELQLSGSSSITTFFLTDGLGSVLGVFSNTASSAALLSTQLVANGNSIGQYTAKGFTGQYADAVSGLEYYVSRYYDPVAGVFLAADKATGNAQGMNPYGYVGNNPETETDPTGQMVCFIGCGGSGGGSGGNGGGTGGSGSGGSSPSGSSPSTLLPPTSCAQLWGCKTGAWQEGGTTSSVDVSSTSGLLTPTCGTLGGFSGPSICVPGLTAVGVPHRLYYRTSVAVPVTLCVPTLVCMDETGGEGATEDATTTTSGELVGDHWFAADNTGGSFEGEGELAQERAKQGIPPRSVEPDDKKTLSILYADGETYVGKSGGTGNDILIQSIPAPARSHAEIDALNQLYADRYLAGTLGQGGEATMYVDRPPCIAYCYMETGSGAIETAMEQIGLDQLTIHYGPGIQDIGKVPYLFPGGTIVIN